MDIEQSQQLYQRARAIIPGGTQTISKRPERYVPGAWPVYWERAEGSQVWDIDGNRFTDFVLALGPVILGYNHPAVTAAVEAQLRKGPLCTLQSPLEVQVAEKLVEHIPCADMVRFFKTGAEATAAAVRIARAYTGREFVLSSGYAGSHDWWVAKNLSAEVSRGVPVRLGDLIADVPHGDIQTLLRLAEEHRHDLACIVVEPKGDAACGEFLQAARRVADATGAVFILDEIVTGFRLGMGGAQAHFGVTPDLATFGKAMANGYPLAATVGRRAFMEIAADLWLTSTYAGEALSLAAAKAVIETFETTDAFARIWRAGARLKAGWNSVAQDSGRAAVDGLDPCPRLLITTDDGSPDDTADAAYVSHMLEAGFLMRRSHCAFVSAAHSDEEIDRAVEATAGALEGADSAVG